MANVIQPTIVREDGSRNAVITFTGSLDTFPLGSTVVIDPAVLVSDPNVQFTQLRVDTIDYVIADGLEMNLAWDATTPVPFLNLYGRGNWSVGKTEGGLTNTSGAGKTGKIVVTSNTPTAGTYTFTIQMWLVKQ